MWPHLCWIRFRYSLAVGVLPEWCLGDPHLFAHFLICGIVMEAKYSVHDISIQLAATCGCEYFAFVPFPLFRILVSPSAQ